VSARAVCVAKLINRKSLKGNWGLTGEHVNIHWVLDGNMGTLLASQVHDGFCVEGSMYELPRNQPKGAAMWCLQPSNGLATTMTDSERKMEREDGRSVQSYLLF
jgi:hypothetical protein